MLVSLPFGAILMSGNESGSKAVTVQRPAHAAA